MKKLTPYLMFNGDCEEAITFYKEALSAELGYLGRYGESPLEVDEAFKNKIMHVELKWDGGSLMASDHLKGGDFTTTSEGSNIHLNLSFRELDEMRSTFNKLSTNGEITREIKDTFWGDKFGMLKDKFGIHWMLNCIGKKQE